MDDFYDELKILEDEILELWVMVDDLMAFFNLIIVEYEQRNAPDESEA